MTAACLRQRMEVIKRYKKNPGPGYADLGFFLCARLRKAYFWQTPDAGLRFAPVVRFKA